MQIKLKYYPALEALLKKVAKASRVHIFDHTLRRGEVKYVSLYAHRYSSHCPTRQLHIRKPGAIYYLSTCKAQRSCAGACRQQQETDDKPDLEVELAGKPVARVHVDYTTKSGVERLHTLLPDEADQLQKTPFAVIQVRPAA